MPPTQPVKAPVWKKMGILFVLFVLQNISLGFTWTLLPLLMREQGLSLGAIGLSALIYSPWAFKFLWASQVDRRFNNRLGRRKTWMLPLSVCTLALLFCLSLTDPQSFLPLVLILVFLLNINIATIDIAVDGYATDILEAGERSLGNTVQAASYTIGHMLGAGGFLIIYQRLGWFSTLSIMAGLYLLLFLPVLIHREMPAINIGQSSEVGGDYRPSARAFLKLSRVRWFLLFLALLSISQNAGGQLRLTMLADLGLNPQDLGEFLLWLGSPLSILGSLAWGIVLRKWGPLKSFISVGLLGVGLCCFSSIVPRGVCGIYWSAAVMLGWAQFLHGAMMVLVYSIIMQLSAGPQSATNYAVLCGINHLFLVGILPVAGVAGQALSYPVFFASLACFYVFTLFAGTRIMLRRLDL